MDFMSFCAEQIMYGQCCPQCPAFIKNECLCEMEVLVEHFIKAVKNKYGDEIHIDYYMGYNNETYMIWHNRLDWEKIDSDFMEFTGNLLNEVFYDNDIWNVALGYDYTKTKELEGSNG